MIQSETHVLPVGDFLELNLIVTIQEIQIA